MELKDYQQQAKRTNANLSDKYKYMNELHMLLGLTTEVGELSDPFKKNLAYKKEIDWVNVGEEIADVMWYLVNFCDITGIDIQDVLQKNINKLKERFPDKFDTDKAINRNLDIEREILEGK